MRNEGGLNKASGSNGELARPDDNSRSPENTPPEATPSVRSRRRVASQRRDYREKSDQEFFESAHDETPGLVFVDELELEPINTTSAVNVKMQNMLMQVWRLRYFFFAVLFQSYYSLALLTCDLCINARLAPKML